MNSLKIILISIDFLKNVYQDGQTYWHCQVIQITKTHIPSHFDLGANTKDKGMCMQGLTTIRPEPEQSRYSIKLDAQLK